jgi:hypothetical protein
MCYEESFFRMWLKKGERRRDHVETVDERPAPKQPERPMPAPAAANAPQRKEVEREAEVV